MSVFLDEFSGAGYGEYDAGATDPSGGVNNPPTISDGGQTSTYRSALEILGSVGRTARDVGTAVGTVRRDIAQAQASVSGAGDQYRTAQRNAAAGNRLGQWWQYATTTDKVMVGLAIAGIAVAVWAATRGAK